MKNLINHPRFWLAIYITGAVWGFGYSWHRSTDCLNSHIPDGCRTFSSTVAGLGWPFVVGVMVTRP